MADDSVKYETKTVRAIRGTESRTVTKWEKDGWEVVSQARGKLQTELTIRRPKKRLPWPLIATVGGALVVALVVLTVNGAFRSPDVTEPAAAPESPADVESPAVTEPTNPAPTPSAAPVPNDAVLDPDSNAELATILGLGDNCDDAIAAFAENYRGRKIAFDANIGNLMSHDGAKTRYDILIGPGDYAADRAMGPTFQFRDVNMTHDLHYTGDVPETIGVGTNLHVTAEIVDYEPQSCLFLLEPVETVIR